MTVLQARPRTRRGPARPEVERGERGSVSLEMVVLAPALLLLVFAVVQASLWFYARSLALAAAESGVAVARAHGHTPGEGVQAAQAWLARNAGDSVAHPAVTLTAATPATVEITVEARSLSLLPGVPGFPVRQSASGPVERFTVGSP
jgi:Flp pilus assembly protein TadG